MAYFANGSEGDMYQVEFCEDCQHWPPDPKDGGCNVWLVHFMYAYEVHGKNKEAQEILDYLIPMKEGGVYADQCSMFLPIEEAAK